MGKEDLEFKKTEKEFIKIHKSLAVLIAIGLIISVVILVSSINFVISQSATQEFPAFNVCCEKTKSGAWCQNAKEEQCDTGFRKTPTSCDATSFCKLGTCVDSKEGLCMENTPQKVCEINKGTWIAGKPEEIPQCSLGCCIIGDQASFVTLTRCKRLSSLYGLETNFRNDINNEQACILTALSTEKGACVFEKEGGKTCLMTTRADCLKRAETNTSKTEFFKDLLCSNDELATNCGPTTETTCVDGRDEVYFKDSCGNSANIYDANRIYSKDPSYWQKIIPKSESCNANSQKGNAGSASCGNCNYLSGSICKKARGAVFGDFICKDINCYNTENGNNYRNGESWCIYQGEVGNGLDSVGSRHFRHVCINGEETVEPCADFRNEVCIEEEIPTAVGGFIEAACRVNRWTDCIDQLEQEDCENTDKRDCYWKEGFRYDGTNSQTTKEGVVNPQANPQLETSPDKKNFGILKGGGICLPNVPPGLEFWKEGNAKSICGLGNSKQVVEFEKGILGDKKCEENCDVLTQGWIDKLNNICVSLGDCGNYINVAGRFTDDGIVVKQNGKIRKISQGIAETAIEEEEKGFFEELFD